VHQADGDSAIDQVGQYFQQRHEAPAFGNMQVLDVGGDDPEKLPGLRQEFDNNTAVDGFVEEKFHGCGGEVVIKRQTSPMKNSTRR
jgi:hypothetical protein